MITDFHMHIFPDFLAEKAIKILAENASLTPVAAATMESAKIKMKQWGVDRGVFLNIATSPRQQNTINNTAAKNNEGNIVCFGSVHPDASDAVEELQRIAALGLKGIKLHPEYQNFYADDKKVFPIYEACSELGLILVFHAGVDLGIPPPVHATPDKIAIVAKNFPNLKIIAAHMGGFLCWDMVKYFLAGTNVYLDTSFVGGRAAVEQIKGIINKHGAEKILLASDFPWDSTKNALDFIYSLELGAVQTELITEKNAERLLM